MTDEAQRRVLIERMWSVGIEVTAVFAVFSGESCVDIPTVRRTVGYLNPALRQERVEKTETISDFAKALGVDKVAAHVGFVPEDRSDSDYGPMADTVGHVADYCAQNNQVFCLETGQETAPTLLRFLQDLDRPNVKVNFDPANMILYGSGEPVEALGLVGDYVVGVHAKDGKWPTEAGKLESEHPLGQGDVGIDRFTGKLKEIGYRGPVTIERKIPDSEQKVKDLLWAKGFLDRLIEMGE